MTGPCAASGGARQCPITASTYCMTSKCSQDRTTISCADDDEAIRVAEQWVDSHDVELWQSNRFITRFIPRREHIDLGGFW